MKGDIKMNNNDIIEKIRLGLLEELKIYNVESVSFVNRIKRNSVIKNGFEIKLQNKNIVPCIYFDEKIPIKENDIDRFILDMKMKFIESMEVSDIIDVSGIDADTIYKISYAFLINYDKNQEILENVIYKRFLNLAIVIKCRMTGNIDVDISFNKDMLEHFNIDEDKLFKCAINNTTVENGLIFEPLLSFINMINPSFIPDTYDDDNTLYVLSNKDLLFGATAICNENILKFVYNHLDEPYYIILSSINEALIIPESRMIGHDETKYMIQAINEAIVSNEEYLSDELYYYNGTEVSVL